MEDKLISANALRKYFEYNDDIISKLSNHYSNQFNLTSNEQDAARYIFRGVLDIVLRTIDEQPAAL